VLPELLSLVSNGFIIPILVVLWLKLDRVEKSNRAVIDWLQNYCPHCGAIRIVTGKN